MCMFLCVILSVEVYFYHLWYGSDCSLFFFPFFLPFLPSHVAGRVLVLWPSVRHELPMWKS